MSEYFNNAISIQRDKLQNIPLKCASFAITGEDSIGLSRYSAITAPLEKTLYISFQDGRNVITAEDMGQSGLIDFMNFYENPTDLNLTINPFSFFETIIKKIDSRTSKDQETITVIIDNYNLMIEGFNRWFINKNKNFLTERDGMKNFGFNFKYEITPAIKSFQYNLIKKNCFLFYLGSLTQEEGSFALRCDGTSAKLHFEQDINYKFLLSRSNFESYEMESDSTKNNDGLFTNESHEDFLKSRKLFVGQKALKENYGIFDIIVEYLNFSMKRNNKLTSL
jgi:hypothetical protein